MYQWLILGQARQTFTRFFGATQGALNYGGLYTYLLFTALIMSKYRFNRSRDTIAFNSQDNPDFWFSRYKIMFPPGFLNNRISAHYIEINHIFSTEMLRRYHAVRKEVLKERETHSQEVRKTKYVTNPNYVYDPLPQEAEGVKFAKEQGHI